MPSGGVASFLSVTGLIACIAARLFDTSPCPLTPRLTFYKLRSIERMALRTSTDEQDPEVPIHALQQLDGTTISPHTGASPTCGHGRLIISIPWTM